MGMCCFLEHCKIVWKLQDKIGTPLTYVPMLHSNTIILEACFSLVLSHEGDVPLKYPGIVGTMDNSNKILAM